MASSEHTTAKKPRKESGKCIFCGNHGLTKEHIFADWLREYIPRTLTDHQTSVTRIFGDKEEVSLQRRTGDPHSRRIHCVCRSCNNGWMSRLQNETKPFLVPMLRGEKTILHRRAQTLIAAWTAMTVMVAEHIDREKIAIPASDRASLRANQRVPPHWRIWIGQHRRQRHPMFTHNVLKFVSKKEIESGVRPLGMGQNTQTSTICLGKHLVIHAMSSIVARSIIRRWVLRPEVLIALAQIWPVKDGLVGWPTSDDALTDAGIDLLATELIKSARPLAQFDAPP